MKTPQPPSHETKIDQVAVILQSRDDGAGDYSGGIWNERASKCADLDTLAVRITAEAANMRRECKFLVQRKSKVTENRGNDKMEMSTAMKAIGPATGPVLGPAVVPATGPALAPAVGPVTRSSFASSCRMPNQMNWVFDGQSRNYRLSASLSGLHFDNRVRQRSVSQAMSDRQSPCDVFCSFIIRLLLSNWRFECERSFFG